MRMYDLAWSLWVICCMCSFWSCLGLMLMRGKFLWKCFIVIMAMSLAYMSLCILLAMLVLKFWLSCLSMSQFWHVVVLFVYLRSTCLHLYTWFIHYQQGGGKYPTHVSRGSFASREEKLGEMHFFRGSLHSCIWELFFAWILVVLLCQWCRALLPHLESRQFWSILSRLCRAVALVLGNRDFSHSSDLFLAFVWLLITCLSFSFIYFLFLFSLHGLLVCFVNALIKGETEDRSVWGPVDGRS
jgi:hypothetical protein